MKKIYIIKNNDNDIQERHAKNVMNDKHYKKYIAKNGYHFNKELAEFASKLLKNADNSNHSWTTEQIENAIKERNENYTSGDMTYWANWVYSDFFPHLLKTENEVLESVKDVIKDKDGYKGMIFMRWVSDIVGKEIDLKWENFV